MLELYHIKTLELCVMIIVIRFVLVSAANTVHTFFLDEFLYKLAATHADKFAN